ncbi:Phosphoribosylformimino-5-aminoimidazole carboxamide ribotide isomerase [Auriculariales sp. MPI-PUGE-AT-0066]|nr:Phosphoribosylformimino-5-aminoimidazole carboxamide ribotide isomerase [Auriculariales sp. MPI-PUGE-AT-0066]
MSLPARRTRFRPCIDLHGGVVKQIVGGTLNLTPDDAGLYTNFVATASASHFASIYKTHNLEGAHVIMLGSGNEIAAREALSTWPNALQVGGGITEANSKQWLDAGASKVIVTSYLFPGGRFDESRLRSLSEFVGPDRLVVDVSCRRRENGWIVATDKWRTLSDLEVNKESLDMLSKYCSEFLIHAADVEGLCQGIDEELVQKLGEWVTIPTTYAGGAKSIDDLDLVDRLSSGKVDLTFGSALDIFGGTLVKFDELVARNARA